MSESLGQGAGNLSTPFITTYTLAVKHIEEQSKNNEWIKQKIAQDESYMPYAARSSVDDLTYDQVIEVMEWLDSEADESKVSSYFHYQTGFHALAASFELEYVRNLPTERKLKLWGAYEKYQQETLQYARDVKEVLRMKKT